nr:cytochrome P450 71AV8-like [Tanacetum cinerariifolium]
MWVLFEFDSLASKEKFLNHSGIGSWFTKLIQATSSFENDERIVWISIEGLPIKAWTPNTFRKITSLWGEYVEWEEADLKSLSYALFPNFQEDDQDDLSSDKESQEGDVANKDNTNKSDVDRVSESSFMHKNDTTHKDVNSCKKGDVGSHSEDPFNIYDQVQDLERSVTYEEVKMAVWDCGTNKSPGPNVFSFEFYRKYWTTIDDDVFQAVRDFFVNGHFPRGFFIGEWNNNNIQTLLSVLRCFYLASGHKINHHKSKLMRIGVSSNVVAAVASLIGCSILTAPFNYLGVKVGSNMMPRGGVKQENYGLLCSKVADLVLPNISDRQSEVPTRWLRVVPIKVNVHAWRVCLDKLPTRANLSHGGMDISSIACPLCNSAVESSSHIFFTCPLAHQVWRNFLIWWELGDVNSYNEWLNWIVNIRLHKQLKMFLEGAQPHQALARLAWKFGPIVRLQLGEVSAILVSSPSVAKEIMKTYDLTFTDRPKLLAVEIVNYNCTDIAFAPYGEYWRQMRKI